jgi:riboflavin biosynthesis pyrimidine reductase
MTTLTATPPQPVTVPWTIEPVWEAATPADLPVRGGRLPAALAARYAADLAIPLRTHRPTIVANFVSTLDGVVAFDPGGPGGGRAVSGGFEPDRFLMGLLRATADAVLVGAGTVRARHTRSWTPERVHAASADAFREWRHTLGLAPTPTAVLVTGSGVLDPEGAWEPRGDQPVIVATTEQGAARLRHGPPGLEVVVLAREGRVPLPALRELLGTRGFRVVVSEAGPSVFGELVAAGAVDELFLTLAPRLAGRSAQAMRPGLVSGMAFGPSQPPGGRLLGVMRSKDHLFLRYALTTTDMPNGGLT